MRTTIDIPDDLYRSVKVLAAERETTVRELVLEGLQTVMRTRQAPRTIFDAPERAGTGPSGSSHETNDDVIGFP